jgi:hypothetical protein
MINVNINEAVWTCAFTFSGMSSMKNVVENGNGDYDKIVRGHLKK